MKRLLPNSLLGQMLLILLAGLIVSNAIGAWIYSTDRVQAVRAQGMLPGAFFSPDRRNHSLDEILAVGVMRGQGRGEKRHQKDRNQYTAAENKSLMPDHPPAHDLAGSRKDNLQPQAGVSGFGQCFSRLRRRHSLLHPYARIQIRVEQIT